MERTHKFVAHFIIEAETPLAVGSGEKGFVVDRLIARDALGLPYIPGTSIAGVLRHALEQSDLTLDTIFGYQEKDKGQGSRLVISDAQLVDQDGVTVFEGIQALDYENPLIKLMQKLPERDHVRISHKGTVDGAGKFDEQLVYKGTRFAFRMELQGQETDKDDWETLMTTVQLPMFRLGAGTRKGFGKLKFVRSKHKTFNLSNKQDLVGYLNLKSSLNIDTTTWDDCKAPKQTTNANWHHYILTIKPMDYFLFGAGFGDDDADSKPKTESVIEWHNQGIREKEYLLIPASSVKGALAHRVAYHYNVQKNISVESILNNEPTLDQDALMDEYNNKFPDIASLDLPYSSNDWDKYEKSISGFDISQFLDQSEVWKKYMAELEKFKKEIADVDQLLSTRRNPAVEELFGTALETSEKKGARGRVLLEDCYLELDNSLEKIFSHVSIDRFTGAARDAMLFQQKVVSANPFSMDIFVDHQDQEMISCFEKALTDLVEGRLTLGGSTTKGHGRFIGEFKKQQV
jgi:CRISPR/Cas system CSM-associated protein Csm3 (group 7 of RAMP superfamily)